MSFSEEISDVYIASWFIFYQTVLESNKTSLIDCLLLLLLQRDQFLCNVVLLFTVNREDLSVAGGNHSSGPAVRLFLPVYSIDTV